MNLLYAILFSFLLPSKIFTEEISIKPYKVMKLSEIVHLEPNVRFLGFGMLEPGSINSYMTSSFNNEYFDHHNMSHWILRSTREKTALQKYFPLLQIHEEYRRTIEEHVKWQDYENRMTEYRKRTLLPHVSRFHTNNLLISPNEKYVLQRDSLETHEFSEVQTGRLLTENIPQGEIVLGFDSQSNIYCGRQTSPPEFVVRDPETMQIVKSFRPPTETTDDAINRDTTEQDLFYTICPVPIESSDRKYVVIQYYQHRPRGVTAEMYHDDPRLLKEWVEAENNNPQACSIGVVHVYDQESGSLVYESPFGIGARVEPMDIIPVISEDGQKIIYPDYAAKGVWVYDFEARKSRSLLIPPPIQIDYSRQDSPSPMEFRWRAAALKGFTFMPDNQILVWLYMHSDKEWPYFPRIFRFDPEDGAYQVMTDFVSEKEFQSENEQIEVNKVMVTWQFFYSPDHRTVITFQKAPGWAYAPEHIGKYVFWDYHTKEKLFETEEKYKGNIILTPDWKTMILTTTSFDLEAIKNQGRVSGSQRGQSEIEFYDITNITERNDDNHELQNH